MQSIRQKIQKIGLLYCTALLLVLVTQSSCAMIIPKSQRAKAQQGVEQVMTLQKYFIHEQNNADKGVWIYKKVLIENSKSLTELIKDAGDTVKDIPLPASVEIIKLTFDILQNKIAIESLSFTDLTKVATLCNFLDVSTDKLNKLLAGIQKEMEVDPGKLMQLHDLHPDLQKKIMLTPIIDCLKNRAINTYAGTRKKPLAGHPDSVMAVAFSPDGTKIVSGASGIQNNLMLWDITDLNNITHKPLVGNQGVRAVAFSPDGTKVVSGCYGRQNNLILWDITDPNNITHKPLAGHPNGVYAVAFSPDGTKVVSGCGGNQNNLMLWDITDPNNITHKPLAGHQDGIRAVAFSPDGTKIVSGDSGNQNNLILWDISDPNNITHKPLAGHPYGVYVVAFSPDGTKVVSGCYGRQNNLILWDITDPNNITHKPLVGHPNTVRAVAFSPDGTKIVSGSDGDQNSLILWDISDLNNITHKSLVKHYSVYVVAFSPDGTKIVSGVWSYQHNLSLWDISDPNNITHKTLAGHPNTVRAVAFSPDGTKIVSGSDSYQNNLILWTLLSQQELSLIQQLQNYTVEQLSLLYQFCLKAKKGEAISLRKGTKENELFMRLPEGMQQLLKDLFFAKGWFAGWW